MRERVKEWVSEWEREESERERGEWSLTEREGMCKVSMNFEIHFLGKGSQERKNKEERGK